MGVLGANAGSKHYAWKGGRRKMHGRIAIYAPSHPRACGKRGRWVYEQILVAERALGRYLGPGNVVHHVDEDPLNNRNDNLAILQGRGEHMSLHARLRVVRAGGNPWTQILCGRCRTVKDRDQFGQRSYNKTSRSCRPAWCLDCARRYQQELRDSRRGGSRFVTTSTVLRW